MLKWLTGEKSLFHSKERQRQANYTPPRPLDSRSSPIRNIADARAAELQCQPPKSASATGQRSLLHAAIRANPDVLRLISAPPDPAPAAPRPRSFNLAPFQEPASRSVIQRFLRQRGCSYSDEANVAAVAGDAAEAVRLFTLANGCIDSLLEFGDDTELRQMRGEYAKAIEHFQSQINSNKEEDLANHLKGCIVRNNRTKWNSIAGLENAKDELALAAFLPQKDPTFFEDRELTKGILLFGPPGTGKTMFAESLAAETCRTLISVTYGDLASKWVGQSSKTIKALFKLARENTPSIIFVDEFDSVAESSSSEGSGVKQDMAMTIATEMNALLNCDGPDVLIIVATNRPWLLNTAILRRFEKRIYVPLPCSKAREQLFKIHLRRCKTNLSAKDMEILASSTEGFSGADIKMAVKRARDEPGKRFLRAKFMQKVASSDAHSYLLKPCESTDANAVSMTWQSMPKGSGIYDPPLTLEMLMLAVRRTKPTVDQADLAQLSAFQDKHGLDEV